MGCNESNLRTGGQHNYKVGQIEAFLGYVMGCGPKQRDAAEEIFIIYPQMLLISEGIGKMINLLIITGAHCSLLCNPHTNLRHSFGTQTVS